MLKTYCKLSLLSLSPCSQGAGWGWGVFLWNTKCGHAQERLSRQAFEDQASARYNLAVRHLIRPPAQSLQDAGLRRTPVRMMVLQILAGGSPPLSAGVILQRLAGDIDKVTLYRTLKTLTEKNLLHRVRGDDQIWRYGFAGVQSKARHEHAHFVCDECGAVECLSSTPASPRAVPKARVRRGYRVDYSEILVHGACPDCRH